MAALDSLEINRTHEPKGKNKPENHKPNFVLRRTLAMGGLLVASTVGAHQLIEKGPTTSNPGLVKEYVVKPGDTAWGISEKAFPGSDPREHTDMIVKETGTTLSPGEKVILPDSAKIGIEKPENSN
jgi:hypothetical protein